MTIWLPWRWRIRTKASRPNRSQTCTSFKDIQTLLQSEPEPPSPKSPSLFRRLSLIHSFSIPRAATAAVLDPPPNSERAPVVVYYTSLRIVRRTYDDCRAIRSILRGFPVDVDERDVSMDECFRLELQRILGDRSSSSSVALPSVFVSGVYIGGADEVKKLYESGELHELIGRLPKSVRKMCDLCGGMRFLVCEECDGSHKVFGEKSGLFRSCSSCNSNGLIRCSACFVCTRYTPNK